MMKNMCYVENIGGAGETVAAVGVASVHRNLVEQIGLAALDEGRDSRAAKGMNYAGNLLVVLKIDSFGWTETPGMNWGAEVGNEVVLQTASGSATDHLVGKSQAEPVQNNHPGCFLRGWSIRILAKYVHLY